MPSSPAAPLVDALDFPAETLRLLTQCRDGMVAEGNIWADYFAGVVRQQIQDRVFHGLLWSGPGEEAVALAGWEVAGTLGRRGWVYLAQGFQRRAVLEGFLTRLESPSAGSLPFLTWADEIPGVPVADRDAVFRGRGLSSTVRADMRLPKGVHPPQPPPDPAFPARPLTLADEPLIADLMFRTYRGEPERALFATTLDERADAVEGTRGLLHGDVGRWLPAASFGIEADGRLVAQTQANELAGGLITEVGVDPAYRRRGFARRLLPLTIDALRSAGFEAPRLVVTMWNPRAVALYQRLGFEFQPGGAGRVWLNLPLLGVLPTSP